MNYWLGLNSDEFPRSHTHIAKSLFRLIEPKVIALVQGLVNRGKNLFELCWPLRMTGIYAVCPIHTVKPR